MITRWMKQASAWPFETPVALFLGAALTFAIMAMPKELFDGYFAATGLPMLGAAGRIVAAFTLGGLAAWGTWRGLAGAPKVRWTIKVGRPSFTPRRADAHPDAPLRRPIFAESELGAPLDSVRAAPRRRSISVASAATRESALPAAPEEALPTPAVSAPEEAIAEAPAPTPPAAGEPVVAAPDETAPEAAPPPLASAIEASERESLAALMQRLEDSLAQRSAAPSGRSAPAAWLVRDDQKQARKSA